MNENEAKSEENYFTGYLAFFDVQGFSEKLNYDKLHDFVDDYRAFIYNATNPNAEIAGFLDLKTGKKIMFDFEQSQLRRSQLHYTIFSDSIILCTDDLSEDSFELILDWVMMIFTTALRNQFPLKGAIDYGEYFFDQEENVIIGKPLVNAYRWAEALTMVGVVISQNCQAYLQAEGHLDSISNQRLISDQTEIRDYGSEDRLYLNWAGELTLGRRMNKLQFNRLFQWPYGETNCYPMNIERLIERSWTFYNRGFPESSDNR